MKSFRIFSVAAFIACIPLLSSCLEEGEVYDPYAQLATDIQTIDNYLAQNGILALKDLRGVRIKIDQLGQGLSALETNFVVVKYNGRILGSTASFDQGTIGLLDTDPALEKYILGWRIAFTTLPVGTKGTLYVPSPLAYANRQQGNIPPNSILEFDFEFQDVKETETEKQRLKSDTTAIDTYITNKGITDVVKDGTGLRYKITEEGAGPAPFWFTPVKLKLVYKMLSDDSKVVLTQTLEPSSTYSSRVCDQINGLKLGLQQMHEGGKATFYVPSGLAFGTQLYYGSNNEVLFPANSNLIIEAELLDVQQ